MNGMRAWVINLDRSPQRLDRISQQLQAQDLPWRRVPAVDARALTAEEAAQLDDTAFRQRHGMPPLAGELGCYLSHVKVMRAFLATDDAFAVVLEDDVLLHPSLPAVLQGLARHPTRWDVVKLSAVHRGTPVPYLEVAPGHQLAVMLSRCTGSSAYILNRRAAQAYLEGLLPMQVPYDHVFDQGWRFGLKFRLVTPTPCGHDEAATTTIAAPSGAPARQKFHWTRRLSTYRYRLGNETRRLLYGLKHAWLERRAG